VNVLHLLGFLRNNLRLGLFLVVVYIAVKSQRLAMRVTVTLEHRITPRRGRVLLSELQKSYLVHIGIDPLATGSPGSFSFLHFTTILLLTFKIDHQLRRVQNDVHLLITSTYQL
jgi:hypothetical protein